MQSTDRAAMLASKIANQDARVGIVGMGYVGLPLAIAFAERGFHVTAFDVDPDKVASLNRGESYFRHLDASSLGEASREGRFSATASYDALAEQDAILVCVPTPLTPQREPDMRDVRQTMQAIAERLRPGQLVVLESTTYPGTTDELVRGILDVRGLRLGTDYFLAYSPEREDPGNRSHRTTTIPKLVGGVDATSGELALALYERVVDRAIAVSDARVAEAAKLTENIFRAVNIALVNELKVVYDRMHIDIWEVLDAASTKPFGFMRFDPGPGLGGHCIPLDPFYLSWKARESGPAPKFIELAGEVNVQMPDYVVRKCIEALNARGQAVQGARVLLLGVAYKPDVDDCRESPAFPLLDRLLSLGAEVSFHDPHIPQLPRLRHWPQLSTLKSIPMTDEQLRQTDLLLIVTHHSAIDYARVRAHASLIVDTRGVLPPGPGVVRA